MASATVLPGIEPVRADFGYMIFPYRRGDVNEAGGGIISRKAAKARRFWTQRPQKGDRPVSLLRRSLASVPSFAQAHFAGWWVACVAQGSPCVRIPTPFTGGAQAAVLVLASVGGPVSAPPRAWAPIYWRGALRGGVVVDLGNNGELVDGFGVESMNYVWILGAFAALREILNGSRKDAKAQRGPVFTQERRWWR